LKYKNILVNGKETNMKEKLLLGVRKVDITPEPGCRLFGYVDDLYSETVNDPLDATAFAFSQGESSAIMVSLTVVSLSQELSDRIRRGISEKTGVPVSNIMLSCTHTHSGPATIAMDSGWGDVDREYCEGILIPATVKAAFEAWAIKEPVTMGYATGESHIGINRRELTLDNKIILGQNPWGPYNPKMSVLSFKNESGACVANMIHYGMHGTCSGHNKEITQDWAGVMVRRMESLTGGVTAFFNGPEGDVGPRLTNGRTTGICDIGYAKETGGKAAFDAMEIYNKIKVYKAPTLTARNGYLKLPLLPRLSKEAAEAKRAHLIEVQKTAAERHLIHTLGKVIDSYSDGYEDKEYNEIEQNVISLDNIVFAGFPYELFSEIGMRIQRSAGELEVLPVAMANGVIGYFPTEDAVCRGGYEINMFKATNLQEYVSDVDFHLVTETLRNIGVDLDSLKK
jgi:hypothetical protein